MQGMTLDLFLKKLEEVRGRFDWSVEENRPIRGTAAINPRTAQSFRHRFCPITAVCFAKKTSLYAVSDWESAAEEIGLNQHLAEDILSAADSEDEETLSLDVKIIRIKIKKIFSGDQPKKESP